MTKPFNALNTGKDWEFSRNTSPICPHCGASYDIDETGRYDVYEEGDHEITCSSCHQEFNVEVAIEYKFSTDEQEANEVED